MNVRMNERALCTCAEAPKLDLSKLAGREIKVRAGEPIRVDVPVTGSPPPVISWQKDNKPLSPSDRVSLPSVASVGGSVAEWLACGTQA